MQCNDALPRRSALRRLVVELRYGQRHGQRVALHIHVQDALAHARRELQPHEYAEPHAQPIAHPVEPPLPIASEWQSGDRPRHWPIARAWRVTARSHLPHCGATGLTRLRADRIVELLSLRHCLGIRHAASDAVGNADVDAHGDANHHERSDKHSL